MNCPIAASYGVLNSKRNKTANLFFTFNRQFRATKKFSVENCAKLN